LHATNRPSFSDIFSSIARAFRNADTSRRGARCLQFIHIVVPFFPPFFPSFPRRQGGSREKERAAIIKKRSISRRRRRDGNGQAAISVLVILMLLINNRLILPPLPLPLPLSCFCSLVPDEKSAIRFFKRRSVRHPPRQSGRRGSHISVMYIYIYIYICMYMYIVAASISFRSPWRLDAIPWTFYSFVTRTPTASGG